MMETVQNNQWVESYLDALLTTGLSKEYAKQPTRDDTEQSANLDADKELFAQYYVSQILSKDEKGIQHAWKKAQAGGPSDAKDVRLEYLAWRVWSMQQMRNRKRRAGTDTADSSPDNSPRSFARHYDATGDITPLGQSYDMRAGSFMDRHLGSRPSAGDLTVPGLQANLKKLHIGSGKTGPEEGGQGSPSLQATPAGHTLFANRVDKLYIVLVSMHGLIRGEKMELGRDADTGGQVKYVVELAKNLALHPMVHRVDLMTRLIKDPRVDASYGEESEVLAPGEGTMGGAYIVRVAAGDSTQYIAKEELWPHVREFADNGLCHIKAVMRDLSHAGEPCDLFAVHGHYADGGEAAAIMSHTLDVDMVLTGHSLGRNKLDHLLKSGTVTRKQIEETYKISRRIEGEERALDAAIMVLSSTQVEIDDQWGLYDGFDAGLAKAMRYRRRVGRHMPRMIVIPPGLEFSSYKVDLPSNPMQLYIDYQFGVMDKEKTMFSKVTEPIELEPDQPADLSDLGELSSASVPMPARVSLGGLSRELGGLGRSLSRSKSRGALLQTARSMGTRTSSHVSLTGLVDHDAAAPEDPPIWREVHQFLRNTRKPVVLAMSRPDAKKNIATLVKAFGSNKLLREIANLVLIMGNRDNIDSLNKGSQQVLQDVLKLIDTYNLYGSVAYPKTHTQKDISDIYKLATETRGVFTNIALQEPFGLTLIEAAVHGAPIVATTHGGPVDIIRTLKNGKLVEPTDVAAVGQAILDILTDSNLWDQYSKAGVANILAYSWPSHCIQYLEAIEKEKRRSMTSRRGNRLSWHDRVFEDAKTAGEPDDSDALQFGGGSPSKAAANALLQGENWHNFKERSTMQRVSCPMTKGSNFSLELDSSLMERGDVLSQSAELKDDCLVLSRPLDGAPVLKLASRTRVAFAVLDNNVDATFLASVLTAALQDRDEEMGLGLLTVFTFNEVRMLLEEQGFDYMRLDFLVCNAGAYILCLDSKGDWVSDEAWESKVLHHWDKQLVLRTLTRMSISRRAHNTGEGGGVLTVLPRETATDLDDGNGPLHCLLNCSPEDSSAAALDNASLLWLVRKRVRSVGIRCHLTLQLVPRSGNKALSILHATPLRGSRALALRHIVFSYGLDMSASTFLCTPASKKREEDGTLISALCSDMGQLVQGSHRVKVIPVSRQVDEELAESKDITAYQRLKVSLAPYSSERVGFIDNDNLCELAGSL